MKSKNPVGRPTKYKKLYCDMLISHMEQGLSYESFAAILRVTRDCLYKWEKSHDEFLYAKKVGAELSLLYWEKAGIDGLYSTTIKEGDSITTVKLNTAAWIFNMKNRHGWRDKTETTHDISDKAKLTLAYAINE